MSSHAKIRKSLCGMLAAVALSNSLFAEEPKVAALPSPPPTSAPHCAEAIPINLAAALQLAGLQNPTILLAMERITEADALRQRASARLLPDLNAGVNYNSHTGPLQQSTGTIIDTNRSALYLGLGAGAVGGGTVAVPGVAWSAQLSELTFGILTSRQEVRRRQFASTAIRNDMLLQVSVAYVELLRAEGRFAIAQRVREDAHEVARLTAAYAQAGQGRQADADRAAAELEQRNVDVARSDGETAIASARLCQLLDLNPTIRLHVLDGVAMPHPAVPAPIPLPELIAIALLNRPELAERRVAIEQALTALRAAKLLPFAPNVGMGFSAGTFGGGSNLVQAGIVQPDGSAVSGPKFGNFGARDDFDAIMYWSLRNLGVGNVSIIRLNESHLRAGRLRETEMLDQVRSEVATASARSQARLAQIEIGERAIQTSANGFERDLTRIRGGEGLPIEVLDSLRLLARSRYSYLDAICDYNRAQFELFVAMGNPPADTIARPVPPELVQTSTTAK